MIVCPPSLNPARAHRCFPITPSHGQQIILLPAYTQSHVLTNSHRQKFLPMLNPNCIILPAPHASGFLMRPTHPNSVNCWMLWRDTKYIGQKTGILTCQHPKQEVQEDHRAKLRAAQQGDGGTPRPLQIRAIMLGRLEKLNDNRYITPSGTQSDGGPFDISLESHAAQGLSQNGSASCCHAKAIEARSTIEQMS